MNVDGISKGTQFQNSQTPPSSDLLKKTQDNTKPASSGALNDDPVQLQISVQRQTLDTLQKIGSITDVLNETAKNMRATGNGLSAAADITAKMRATLDKITKNYPPFSIDDTERRDILMSYSSLRKEMEKMMVPTPPQPVYDKVKTLWKELFGGNRTETISTPNLPENAPDTVIVDATKQLAATGDAISTMHAAIGASL